MHDSPPRPLAEPLIDGDTRTWRQRRGDAAEALAGRHLMAAGLVLLERGYRRRVGEIDLIGVQPATGTLVFVEVRLRRGLSHGGPLASVDRAKRARIGRAVRAWLAHRRADARRPVRIDVIGLIDGPDRDRVDWPRVEHCACRWVRGAIELDE